MPVTMEEINSVLESITRLSRILMQKSATEKIITDNEIASCKSLLPRWKTNIKVEPGECYVYEADDKVYRVREGQGHTTQESWTPDKTPALWAVIDVTHAGSKEDPIPASRGMDYIYGKYYLDPEDSKIYLCKREGEPDGGTINLQYLPHELIGQYFEVAV